MADISKCKGTDCPIRDSCYRYKAESNPFRQSYIAITPYDFKLESCEYYWEYEKDNNESDNTSAI